MSMLEELFALPSRATIATLSTVTTPKLKPGAPPNVQKRSLTQVMLNSTYKNAINNQLAREGKEPYEPQPRKWGKRIPKTCLVEHKGKYYLETQYMKTLQVEYYSDGVLIPTTQIEPFLREQTYLTEKPVIWRDYSLDSIEWIHVNNKKITK